MKGPFLSKNEKKGPFMASCDPNTPRDADIT